MRWSFVQANGDMPLQWELKAGPYKLTLSWRTRGPTPPCWIGNVWEWRVNGFGEELYIPQGSPYIFAPETDLARARLHMEESLPELLRLALVAEEAP